MGLPWYHVHIVVLNNLGRLIVVHLMHAALCSSPPQRLYKGLHMGNVEIVLSSVVVFFATFVIARTMWYGSTTTL
ncbi:unnamed protein product [Sphagnum jensenii]|uniref:Uncharacterized protein n=1 Tax=Sphagnum jensenii TaxID=128206 RepID=A0ABP0ZY72_9BRYO